MMRLLTILCLATCATGVRPAMQEAVSQAASGKTEETQRTETNETTQHKCCVCDLSWGSCKKGSYGYAKRSSATQKCKSICGLTQRCWDEDPVKDCSEMGM
mmetsp:Transcript_28127/g.45227  ORF Transcript_28127/g.45227 Transcript_28127/m.45227 type:complete len:101 (+) Transcript_28127:66-368(+)